MTKIALAIVGKAMTIWKQYRKDAMNQSTKNEAKRLRATTLKRTVRYILIFNNPIKACF